MVEYDYKIIQEFAKRLYDQSRQVTMRHFLIGVFAGLLVFGAISNGLLNEIDFLVVSLGVLIGGFVGYGSGRNRAFEMKLQAQVALCQVRIEENTRRE